MTRFPYTRSPAAPLETHWRVKDMRGQRFGRLTVVSHAGKLGSSRSHRWACRCECGAEIETRGEDLRNGTTKSCGCLHREAAKAVGDRTRTHGKTGSPEHTAWLAMRGRCGDPHDKDFKNYGARGITVCQRWHAFENFLADMGSRPDGMSIDRIDNDGNYEPGNCRWATPTEQARNKRGNRVLELGGARLCLTAWAERLDMPVATLEARLRRGWDVQRALTAPVDRRFSRA